MIDIEHHVTSLQERVNDLDVAAHRDRKEMDKIICGINVTLDKHEARAKEHSRRLDSEELQRATVIASIQAKLASLTAAWIVNTAAILGVLILSLILIFRV